jgi:VWFA-related protein
MIRSFARFAVFLAVAIAPAFAQSPTPAPSKPAMPADASKPQTIKANAQLVVVDVVVTDHNRNPVHGLKAGDFTLKDASTPQTIKNFEEHSAPSLADATKFAPIEKLPPGVFTNYTPAPANGAVNLLLLDALNTPMADQAYVRDQLLAYLKATPPGTRMAIFGLTTHLAILQGFTSDPEVLKRIMAGGLSKASVILDDPTGGGGVQNSQADDMEDLGADAEFVANIRQFEAMQQSFQLQLRIKYTLDAMNQLARYLATIPGRKNLIWFSGSFPLNVLPDATLNDPFAGVENFEEEFRDTVSLLARSQVAVYPIDARGLMNSPVFDASTTRNYGGSGGPARMNQDDTKFFTDTAAERSTMQAMADATGGRAFVGTNGLTAAVASAITEGSNFYTLTYTPASSEPDGKFHKIKVELDRQGLNLSYRKGYYADRPKQDKTATNPTLASADSAGPGAVDKLRLAMTRGAPTPSEIVIKVGVLPINPANQPEDKPAARNTLAPSTHGPYRRYSVNYLIDPTSLEFLRTNDGKIYSDFALIIDVFDPLGKLVNSTTEGLHVSTPLDQAQKMAREGIFKHEEISAPIHGEYFFRIAVHDLHRDRYGAVEVAASEVKNVTVPTAPAEAATH